MKAIVYKKYGPPEVLKLIDTAKPVPRDNEILVKIKATAVNSGDVRLRKADPFAVRFFFGLMKPKRGILGSVFSGEIESAGKDVTLFKTGDEIFGVTDMTFGAYAEYISLPENGAYALKPQEMSHEEASVIPFGGTTALHFIRLAKIQEGQKMLIYGASGAIGTAAVQIAKHYGAIVTGVCSSTNLELVRSLGADSVIDYTKEDFTKSGETYDVIMDTVGKAHFSHSLKSLSKNGKMILSAAGLSEMLKGAWTSLTSSQKVLTGVSRENAETIVFLKTLVEAGHLKPVIDRTYPLAAVAEAHAYVEKGHKKGNVCMTV